MKYLQNHPALTWSTRGTDSAAAATAVTAFVIVCIAAADELLMMSGEWQSSDPHQSTCRTLLRPLRAHDHEGDEDDRQRHAR